MSQEGYANPAMNDGPRFHSIIPVGELTERVTQARAIGTRDKTQPLRLRETEDGVTHITQNRPLLKPNRARGLKTQKKPGSMTPNSPHPSATLRLHTKRLGLRPQTRPISWLCFDCTPNAWVYDPKLTPSGSVNSGSPDP